MRKKLKKRNSVSWVTYTVVLLIGLAMLYPIIWMFFATFKLSLIHIWDKIYRPHAWTSFGTQDTQAADYAACRQYGPLYQ